MNVRTHQNFVSALKHNCNIMWTSEVNIHVGTDGDADTNNTCR